MIFFVGWAELNQNLKKEEGKIEDHEFLFAIYNYIIKMHPQKIHKLREKITQICDLLSK